jgi:AcrR family transcriptional regulator
VGVPRTDEANKRIRQDARARILAGARSAFARKGMATTMADIASAAGVSQGLAYRYFSDKDDLVRAVVAEAVRQANDDGSWLDGSRSAAERLYCLIASLVEARRTQPELFLLLEHVVGDPATPQDLLDLIQARGRAVREAMRQLVIDAQAGGDVAQDDPAQLVTAIMACLHGLGRFALGGPEGATERFPDAEIVIRMLRPSSAMLRRLAASTDGEANDHPG